MRIAIFGGAFDPPHAGHQSILQRLLETNLADLVYVVPTAYHAFGKKMAPHQDRVRWCEIMAAPFGSMVVVEPIEAQLQAPSLTINTLRALRERHPGDELRLVIGEDNARVRDQWEGWSDIETEFPDYIVVGRAGASGGIPPEVIHLTKPIELSSTMIRNKIRVGEPVDGLLDAEVEAAYREYLLHVSERPGVVRPTM